MQKPMFLCLALIAGCVPQGGAPTGAPPTAPVATSAPSASGSTPMPGVLPSAAPNASPSPLLVVLGWGKGEVVAGNGSNGNWKNNPHNATETSMQDVDALLPQRDASAIFIEEDYNRITELSRPLNPTLELENPYRILTQLAEVEAPTGLVEVSDGYYIASRQKNNIYFLAKKELTLKVVAGRGNASYSGDGRPGTDASLYAPVGLVRGSDGSLYWAEENNHVIRKLAPDGIISTVVGDGVAREDQAGRTGAVGDVRLKSPIDVALGPDGSLYFIQLDDPAVFRLTNGSVDVVAGTGVKGFWDGLALASNFKELSKIVMGPDGLLYLVDTGNDRIRRLNSDGTVATVAGSGRRDGYVEDRSPNATDIRMPTALAFDPDGGMWVFAMGSRHLIYFAASK